MASRRAPAARLVLVPVVSLLVLVVGLQALQGAVSRPADPALLLVPELAPEAGEVVRCQREHPDTEPAERLAERFDAAGRVTTAMVVACPRAFDGHRVVFVGEIVGDLLRRRGGAWTQVNDDAYALEVGPLPAHGEHRGVNSGLQVWIPEEHLDGLRPGRPGRRGHVVELTGVVHRADPQDAGGLTLRADEVVIVAEPVDVESPLDHAQLALAVGACLLAGGIWLRRRAEGHAVPHGSTGEQRQP
ncbi:hypothetical protein [Egicoccus sp. AB-alg6-2]|uniref:hypothetical protein n=1 Tax=Egicoccus sp. AB-alg6-2 TaxID=3242692 RepID=UPI00359D9B24